VKQIEAATPDFFWDRNLLPPQPTAVRQAYDLDVKVAEVAGVQGLPRTVEQCYIDSAFPQRARKSDEVSIHPPKYRVSERPSVECYTHL
jgi:hypothetical protein